MKLALGTVQFGQRYGAFNASGGRPEGDQIAAILDLAQAARIDTLDTARAYGESEAVLGAHRAPARFRIVTKVPGLNGAGPDAIAVSVEASLKALGTTSLDGLMIHAADDLLADDGGKVWKELEAVVGRGQATRIGASVYTVAQADALLSRYPLGLIQLPMNVFDRRFERAGFLARARAAGVEVHVRSVFLQGFALADPANLPPPLARHQALLERFVAMVEASGTSRLAAALGSVAQADRIVVGVDGIAQFEEILAATKYVRALPELAELASDDETLLDPGRWR